MEDYLASGLEREESLVFEAHRQECPQCRRYLQDILRLAALLKAKGPVLAPAGLWDKIESRLGRDVAAAPVTPIHRFMKVLSAVAAVALVTLGVLLLQPERAARNLDRIQTTEISWVNGEDGDEIIDPISNMLMSPKAK